MDGIRSSSGGSGCLLAVRRAGEFRPGERHPRGARGGRRGAPGAGVPAGGTERWARSGRRLQHPRLAGAGRREGKERRWEAPTPGQRRLPGNFVVKSKDSKKEKHKPYQSPATRVSPAARRLGAPGSLLCAAPPKSAGRGHQGRCLGLGPAPREKIPAAARSPPPHTPAHGCPCVPPSTASWPGPGARRTGLCSEPRAPWGATLAPSVTSYLFPTPTQKSSLRGMLTSSLETRRSWVCTGLERHHRGHSSPLPSEPLEGALWWTRVFLMNSVPKSHGGSGAATPRAWGPGGHLGTGPAPARRTASAGVWSAAGSRGQRPDA